MPDLLITATLKNGEALNFDFDPHSFFVSLGVMKPMLEFIRRDTVSVSVSGDVAYAENAPDWRAHFVSAMLR